MPDSHSPTDKSITLILLVVWGIWSLGLAAELFQRGEVILWGFTVYDLLSMLVLYMFGRVHDLEVDRLLGVAENSSGNNDDSD